MADVTESSANPEAAEESKKRSWYALVLHYAVKASNVILPSLQFVQYAAGFASYGLAAYGLSMNLITARQALRMTWAGLLFGPRPPIPWMVSCLSAGVIHMKRGRRKLARYLSSVQIHRHARQYPVRLIAKEVEVPLSYRLDASDKEIRLLYLHAGGDEDEVRVRTIIHSLHEEPRYITLSYVWGDVSVQHSISVDGHSASVSTNLLAALKLLRNVQGKDAGVPFWIDALSINQNDPEERSSQVQMMKKIYEHAYKIWIWLDQPSVQSELALAKMRAIEAYFHIAITESSTDSKPAEKEDATKGSSDGNNEASEYYLNILPGVGLSQSPERRERDNEPWVAIHRMLESPWWTRAWIAQEVSSPASHSTPLGNIEIILGRQGQTISFRSTVRLVPFFTQILSRFGQDDSDETGSEEHKTSLEFMKSLHKIAFDIRRLTSVGILRKGESITQQVFQLIARTSTAGIEHQRFQSRVWPLLMLFRRLNATEPRDKVYASLPLVLPPDHPAFRPDYSLPLDEVYADVVASFIKYEGTLRILASCAPSPLPFPSFVPNWNTAPLLNELCNEIDVHQHCIYQACGDTRPHATVTKESGSPFPPPDITSAGPHEKRPLTSSTRLALHTRGISVDTITSLSPICTANRSFRRPEWETLLVDSLPSHYSPTNEPLTCAYQRLLVADIRSSQHYELNGYTGTRLQKWEYWVQVIIEDEIRAWWKQEHRYEQSFSILNKFEERTGKNWLAATRGARVDAELDLETQPGQKGKTEDGKKKAESVAETIMNTKAVCTEQQQENEGGMKGKYKGGSRIQETASEAAVDEAGPSNRLAPTTTGPPSQDPSPKPPSSIPASREIPDSLLDLDLDPDPKSSRPHAEDNFRELVSKVTVNRVLCVTENGYAGLVPQHAKIGDQVVVLFGGPTPFVLRMVEGIETETETEKEPGGAGVGWEPSWRWQLVGEAYIHGIMDGEAMEMGLEGEEFVLI